MKRFLSSEAEMQSSVNRQNWDLAENQQDSCFCSSPSTSCHHTAPQYPVWFSPRPHLTQLHTHPPFGERISCLFPLFSDISAWEHLCYMELNNSAGGWSDQYFCDVCKTLETVRKYYLSCFITWSALVSPGSLTSLHKCSEDSAVCSLIFWESESVINSYAFQYSREEAIIYPKEPSTDNILSYFQLSTSQTARKTPARKTQGHSIITSEDTGSVKGPEITLQDRSQSSSQELWEQIASYTGRIHQGNAKPQWAANSTTTSTTKYFSDCSKQ